MKKLQTFLATFILVAAGAFMFIPVSPVGAAGALEDVCKNNPGESAVCSNRDKKSSGDLVGSIVNTLLFVMGVVSVLAIIIGGFSYTISSGNAASVTKAKNTILYAIIGLVVSFSAYAIVNWVFKLF